MSVIICRTCGLEQSLPEGQDVLCCPACGTNNSRPQAVGESLDKLQRATRLRLAREYAEAETCYRHVLLDVDEHEALWGKLLCQYGVEFVCEAASGRRYPVVHIPQVRPLQETSDFEQACALAPEDVRRQYEADAAYIDEAQAEIRCLAETCPPYDVFLCHKTTLAGGEGYTKDYVRADELYTWLKGEGYRVFFAPKEMPAGIAGANYEAMIYHALHTAKVMLVICSDAQNISATRVQSEWQRYLTRVDKREGRLAPLLYGGFSTARLPREFTRRKLEAVTMESLGAQNALLALVEKCCGTRREAPAVPEFRPTPAPQPVAAPPPEEEPLPVMDFSPDEHFTVEQNGIGCVITKYTGPGGQVNIPPVIGRRMVVGIGEQAFYQMASVTGVSIPSGVRSIGDFAFFKTGLRSVTLPHGLQTIGKQAFGFIETLTTVDIPRTVKSMGKWVFERCAALKTVVIREGVTAIPYGAFMECPSLTDVSIPGSVEVIEEGAFQGDASLTNVTIARGVKQIHANVFRGCTKLAQVTLPEGLESIGDGAFFKTGLRSVTLPQGLQSIGKQAFDTITTLTAVDIPGTVKTIGKWAFERCAALKTVVIREGVTAIPYGAFMDCPSLTEVSIPGSVEVIEEAAFQGDAGLTNVMIAPGVKQIHANVFRSCKQLARVTLPEGLESIGRAVFCETAALTTLVVPETVRSIGPGAFSRSGLRRIRLPRALSDIDGTAFDECPDVVLYVWKNSPAHIYAQSKGLKCAFISGM